MSTTTSDQQQQQKRLSTTSEDGAGGGEDEEDLEKLQKEIERMEAEAARITKEAEELEKKKKADGTDSGTTAVGKTSASTGEGAAGGSGTAASGGSGDKPSRDGHSIYVGQVDYSSTPEDLLAHFSPCGMVERVTIVCDKYTGRPKGFAYLEFQTEQAVENALKLDGSEFKGRNLKVTHKRVNQPSFMLHQQQQAAAAAAGAAGGQAAGGVAAVGGTPGMPSPHGGGYRGGFRGGYRGRGRGRGGRGFRGRGRGGYHPYY